MKDESSWPTRVTPDNQELATLLNKEGSDKSN
jgi:hypothetical protein